MKLKKFEQQPKHVDNIPIEAINLDSEQEQPPKPDKAVGKNVFQPNSKYFTIVIYGLLFVLGAILIYKFIGNWPATVKSLGNIFHILVCDLHDWNIIYIDPTSVHHFLLLS